MRIYLDWNIFSFIKRDEFKELRLKLESLSEYAIFPFSPAHFTDLMKSYSPDGSNAERFQQDLNTLSLFCGDNYFCWDKEKQRTMPFLATPQQIFEERKDTPIQDFLGRDNFLSLFDDDEYMTPLKTIMEKGYSSLPAFDETTMPPESWEAIKKMYPSLPDNPTMWDFILEMSDHSLRLHESNKEYKKLRTIETDNQLSVNISPQNDDASEVFSKMDALISKMGAGDDFMSFVKQSISYNKSLKQDRYTIFTSAYLMLDMFGCAPDKLKKKTNSISNITADGEHSFYAAHCDILVTDDEKLRFKSDAMYKQFNIATQIFSPSEFLEQIDSICSRFDKFESLFDSVIPCISQEEPSASFPFLLGLFNRVEKRVSDDPKTLTLGFWRESLTYSEFVSYSESDLLLSLCIKYFGGGDTPEMEKLQKDFAKQKDYTVNWHLLPFLKVQLFKTEEALFPVLLFIIDYEATPQDKENK